MTKDEAMRSALNALITAELDGNCEYGATNELRAALAQPDVPESCFGETKPVAWADKADIDRVGHDFWVSRQKPAKDGIPLYFAPIKKEWIGLTEQEKKDIFKVCAITDRGYVAAMVEALLKEKNNG